MNEELIARHLELVLKENETTNITRISSFEEGMVLHIEDSLVALPEIEEAPDGLYGDLGSGGGYPGIPLAIATERKTVLVDSIKKKAAILDRMIEELGLSSQVSTYGGRIEDLARERKEAFAVLTARALAKLSILMELGSPLLKTGGRLVCYKAKVDEEELAHALELQKKFGMKIVSDRSLVLSDGETTRRILCFEKTGSPQVKLPRKTGMAQKHPF